MWIVIKVHLPTVFQFIIAYNHNIQDHVALSNNSVGIHVYERSPTANSSGLLKRSFMVACGTIGVKVRPLVMMVKFIVFGQGNALCQ